MRRLMFVVTLIAACGGRVAPESTNGASAAGPPETAAPAGTGAAEPRLAPRPFTAEQIRKAMPAGTEIRYRIEEQGRPPVLVHSRVTAADAASMTMESRVLAEDGSLLAEEPPRTTKWVDLLEHANFPADRTVQSRGTVEVPAGKFETLDYVVTETAKGTVSTFRFAPSLPGPPVSLEVKKDGTVVQRMVLLSRQ